MAILRMYNAIDHHLPKFYKDKFMQITQAVTQQILNNMFDFILDLQQILVIFILYNSCFRKIILYIPELRF